MAYNNLYLKYSAIFAFIGILITGCQNNQNSSTTKENLLEDLPKEPTHVDSIITNKPLPLTYSIESYSTQPTTPIEQDIIPLKTTNSTKANDTLHADVEIPDTIKNIKPEIVALKPFISYVNHPVPQKAREMRSSSLANTDIQFLNVEQGLPNTNINDIDEDNNGFLWLSHSNGITRYDGNNFYNYTTKNGLPNNYIYSILINKKNQFWMLSPVGLVFYDGIKFKTYNNKSGIYQEPIRDFILDDNDQLWFSHQRGGIGKIVNDTVYYYTEKCGIKPKTTNALGVDSLGRIFISYSDVPPSIIDKNKILNYSLNKLGKTFYWYNMLTLFTFRDKDGNMWTSNYGGHMIKTSPHTKSQRFLIPTGFNYDVTSCMAQDKTGKYWFGTNDGGAICKDDTSYSVFTIKQGLSSNRINNIIADKNNNIWIATATSGINRIKQGGFKIYGSQEGFTNKLITTLSKDSKDNLIIGTAVDGLWFYNGKAFIKPKCIGGQIIVTAIEDNTGRVLAYDGNGFNYEFLRSNKNVETYDQQKGVFFYPTLNYVLASHKDVKNRLWLFTPEKGLCVRYNDTLIGYTTKTGLAANAIRGITSDTKGRIWLANANCGISLIDGKTITHFTKKEGLLSNNLNVIFCDSKNQVWIGSALGLNMYNGKQFYSFETNDGITSNLITSIVEDSKGDMWIGTANGLNQLSPDKEKPKGYKITNYYTQDGLKSVSFNRNAAVKKGDELFWGTSEGLLSLDVNLFQNKSAVPEVKITDVDLFDHTINYKGLKDSITNHKNYSLSENSIDLTNLKFDSLTPFYNYPKHLILPYNINSITFRFATLSGNLPHKIKYRCILKGYEDNWNAETSINEIKYGNLPSGNFEFNVQAKINNQEWGNIATYQFTISPPFWERWWFRAFIVSIIIALIWQLFKWRNKQLIERQIILEKTVDERTKEINHQKNLIEEKQKEIVDSITYAKRIQYALLASDELLNKNLNNYFIYFNPKDLVSGDFYWATQLANGNFVLATADSTGHGVPGAIMSILNISCLNESIKGDKLIEPADILNETRKKIIHHLANDGSLDGGKDGMDCSLISLNPNKTSLTYSAANNAVWIIRNKELSVYPADRMPVGKHDKDTVPFKQKSIELNKGDIIYTFTDGFPDQFGGPYGKKFKYKQLEEFLISISHEPMNTQEQLLKNKFNEWKGDHEQIDDVLVIGIRV